MSKMPYPISYNFPGVAVPRKRPTDQPAAVMAAPAPSSTRPPLGERPVGNSNITASASVLAKLSHDVPVKAPVLQQPHQHHFATPNQHKAKSAGGSTERVAQNYLSASGKYEAPFKSPVTLCFERMLGAGK